MTNLPLDFTVGSQNVRLTNEFVLIKYAAGATVPLTEAKLCTDSMARILNGKKTPALIDIRNIKSVDREARIHYAGAATGNIFTAAALLIDSPMTKTIGNFFLGINKPTVPTKLFSSEEEAISWLKKFPGNVA